MMGLLKTMLRWAAALAVALLLNPAVHAHELSMAEMQVREMAPGEFLWQWTASEKRAPAEVMRPVWPEGCEAGEQTLRCPRGGLVGRLSVDGVGKTYSAAMVRITWLGGERRVYAITQGQPSVQLYGSADDSRADIFAHRLRQRRVGFITQPGY